MILVRRSPAKVWAQPNSDEIISARDILDFEDDGPGLIIARKFEGFVTAQTGGLGLRGIPVKFSGQLVGWPGLRNETRRIIQPSGALPTAR